MLWMPHFTGAGIVVNCTNRTNIRNRRVTEGHQKGTEMIYIENTSNDPAYNLAFEEYIFMNTDYDEPVLLLWQNAVSEDCMTSAWRYCRKPGQLKLRYGSGSLLKLFRKISGKPQVFPKLYYLSEFSSRKRLWKPIHYTCGNLEFRGIFGD